MSWRLMLVSMLVLLGLVGCRPLVGRADLGLPIGAQAEPANDEGWATEAEPAPIPVSVPAGGFVTEVAPGPVIVAEAPSTRPYLLDTGDTVRIFVYGQPNLSRNYTVDGAGFVSLPLVGTVKARAGTTYDLAGTITRRLAAKYVRDPEVSIEIARYRPFFILGEVRNGGQYPFVYGMTARTAVAVAGGYSPRANEHKVRITRVEGGDLVTRVYSADAEVRPGDTIYVEERWF